MERILGKEKHACLLCGAVWISRWHLGRHLYDKHGVKTGPWAIPERKDNAEVKTVS